MQCRQGKLRCHGNQILKLTGHSHIMLSGMNEPLLTRAAVLLLLLLFVVVVVVVVVSVDVSKLINSKFKMIEIRNVQSVVMFTQRTIGIGVCCYK